MRYILHSDCNSFYASVECLHRPEIRNKPVAVSGNADDRHGIILTKNQIAKKFGVKTGEAIWQAKQKCPELITVPPNFPLYKRFSKMTREIYGEYSEKVEPFGLDEAWLDISGRDMNFRKAKAIAEEIRQRIKYELGITVSIGVSFNKIFAKLGSDYKKPDAVTLITDKNYRYIVWPLPVEDLLFVGPATKKKLNNMGIYTIGNLANCPLDTLVSVFGKNGNLLSQFANGSDKASVAFSISHQNVKSIGNSTTTYRDLKSVEDIKIVAFVLSDSVARRLREQNMKAWVIGVSIRDNNLNSFTRQKKLSIPTDITEEIAENAVELFLKNKGDNPLRSIGISLSELIPADTPVQMSFFSDAKNNTRLHNLDCAVDSLKRRFGAYCVQPAVMLNDRRLSGFNPKDDHTIHPVGYFTKYI